MPVWLWLLAGTVLLYVAAVVALALAGRGSDARALAGFVPDCLVLFQRLLRDPRIPRARKLPLLVAVVYLAIPVDLVPDFIPVAGQLDDAIVVVLALRALARRDLIEEHWPGPPQGLKVIRTLS
jgi:uncharacterized membrane protein YkvA (DUF1232 family)